MNMAFTNKIFSAWRKVRDTDDYNKKLKKTGANLDFDGREILDPTPMEPPVGWKKAPHVYDMMRNLVTQELSRRAQEQGFESFEESEDFDWDDESDSPRSPHENEGEPSLREMVDIGNASLKEKATRQSTSSGAPGEAGGRQEQRQPGPGETSPAPAASTSGQPKEAQ